MMLSDNIVLFTLSRLILNQFMAVGNRYGITSFSIAPHAVRLKSGTHLLRHWPTLLRLCIA